MDGPYRDGRVHVLAEKCATCIFRPGNRMRLAPGRVKWMVEESVAADGGITCHQTLPYYPGEPAVCRGFFDAHGERVTGLRTALALGIVEYDDAPATAEGEVRLS